MAKYVPTWDSATGAWSLPEAGETLTPAQRLLTSGIWYGTQSELDALDNSLKKTLAEWLATGDGYFEFHVFASSGVATFVVAATSGSLALSAHAPSVLAMRLAAGVTADFRLTAGVPTVSVVAAGVISIAAVQASFVLTAGVPTLTIVGAPGNTAPTAPTGLSANAFLSDGMGYDLHWTAASDPDGSVASYNLYKNGSLFHSGATGTSYSITGQTAGSTADWQVAAVDNLGLEGALSSAASVTIPPAAPTGHSSVTGDTLITMHPGTATNATSYKYYIKAGSDPTVSSYDFTGTVTDGQTKTGLTNGTAYHVGYTAVNAGGESVLSSIDTVTPAGAAFYTQDFESATLNATSYDGWTGSATSGFSKVNSIAHGGTRAWHLSTDSSASVSKTLAVRAGALTFWRKTASGGVDGADVGLFVDGASVAVTLIGGSSSVGQWGQYSYTLAVTGSHTIKFQLDAGGDDGYIDDISIPVP